MIDISFTYADLEYFLLILVRISCFVYAAPFFSMSNVPRTAKIGFSLFLSYLLFHAIDRNEVVYESLLGYAVIVMKEALTGFVIGWGAQICATVTSFAGSIADMEIGLSMVSLLDPATKEQATFTGVFYQYVFTLFMIISGLYQYLLSALADTFTLIPINGAMFKTEALMSSVLLFLSEYVSVGFRIILPIFCAMIFLNCVLGILAKVSPQLNMFAVGIQFKVLVGLGILFLSVQMLPTLADNIFTLMKRMIVSFVEGMI